MPEYQFPTVIQPAIANADMTPLERLVLTTLFESRAQGDALYLFAPTGPHDVMQLPAAALRQAVAASGKATSPIAQLVLQRLGGTPAHIDEVELDFSETSWEFIFQEIIRRSPKLEYVSVTTAFTCSEMKPDGFGGMAVLITANAVAGKTTEDLLNDLLDDAERGLLGLAPGHGWHVLARLEETDVREALPQIIQSDPSLSSLRAEDVSDPDIRAACIAVTDAIDPTEIERTTVTKAAMAAIAEAERRRADAG